MATKSNVSKSRSKKYTFAVEEDADEELPQHVLDGIERGQEDIAAGRTITLDEFKEKFL